MNRFTFVLPSENQNAFRLLSICANAVYNVIQSLNRQGHLVDQTLSLSIDRKYAKCRTKANAHNKMGFQYISISVDIVRSHARTQRGDRGSGHPHLKNHKNIEFLSNRPDPLKFSKLPSQHSTLGHHRHASETPFKGVSLAGR